METDDNFQHRNIIDNSNVMIGGGDGSRYRQLIKKVEKIRTSCTYANDFWLR